MFVNIIIIIIIIIIAMIIMINYHYSQQEGGVGVKTKRKERRTLITEGLNKTGQFLPWICLSYVEEEREMDCEKEWGRGGEERGIGEEKRRKGGKRTSTNNSADIFVFLFFFVFVFSQSKPST